MDYHEVIATGGKDAPGIGWYLNDKFAPGQTRWQKYSDPLPASIPDVTVVSGTCDRLPYLKTMIESARKSVPYGVKLHFVIVDGGSADGTLEYLRQQPDVTLIEQGKKLGIAAAYRDGFDAAEGRYIVTANDDIEFLDDAIFRGMTYLETHSQCGGVAFEFINPTKNQFHHNLQSAIDKSSKRTFIPYIQVGIVRKSIGDLAGWWGGHDKEFPAKNYGLDNYLTSRIWELGYTVDVVRECRFRDFVPNDKLREHNMFGDLHAGVHPDSLLWRKRFNGGYPAWNATPVAPQQTEHLRILYTPILSGVNEFERNQMCGLYESLQKVGITVIYDYIGADRSRRNIEAELVSLVKQFKPHLWVSQLHAGDIITPLIFKRARSAHPSMVCINWNGDESRFIWKDASIVDIMRSVDLATFVNPALFAGAVERGINAAVWLDSYQPVEPIEMPEFDVVYCGTNYSPRHDGIRKPRQEMIEAIRRRLPDIKLGVYGHGWANGNGEHTYDFSANHGTYEAAKIAIVDNMYQDAWGYISSRFYNSLRYGQFCLVQKIEGAKTLFGEHPKGDYYVEWTDYDDLCAKIEYYLDKKNDKKRKAIGKRGREHLAKHHSFDARVRELFDMLPMFVKKNSKLEAAV